MQYPAFNLSVALVFMIFIGLPINLSQENISETNIQDFQKKFNGDDFILVKSSPNPNNHQPPFLVNFILNENNVGEIYSSCTGFTWMDRNLGSQFSVNEISVEHQLSYGDLYQWGRSSDGHEKEFSSTTTTLSRSDSPGHSRFIINNEFPHDWRESRNNQIWQGVNGINNPCPRGFRLPTASEWQSELECWEQEGSFGAMESELKLSPANARSNLTGKVEDLDNQILVGAYWSSTTRGDAAYGLFFGAFSAQVMQLRKSMGASVRCIKDR